MNSHQTQEILTKVEVLDRDTRDLKQSMEKHEKQIDEIIKVVHENSVAMKDSMGELTGELRDLVAEMRVKSNNDEHIKSEVDILKIEVKEFKTEVTKDKEKAWPILRKAKEAQELRSSMLKAMASNTGKIIIGLVAAGLIYTIAVTFGLEIKAV